MHLFLAGITLALAGQVAAGNRYLGTEDGPDLAPPPAAGAAAAEPTPASIQVASETPPPASAGAGASPVTSEEREDGAPQPAALAGQAGAVPLDSRPQAPASQGAPPRADGQVSVLVAGPKPSELMRSLLKPPASGQLSGVSLTLGQAVRDAKTRQDQTQRAKAYWDLSATVADYYLAQLEEMELQVLRQGLKAPGKAWDAKQQAARSRVDVARRTTQSAQLRLHQLLGRSAGVALPLPGDVPHCGRYNAEYDEIFASRPDLIARELSELLPLRYADLRAQTQAVEDAVERRAAVRDRLDPNGDGTDVLEAQELLSLRRRAFVATTRDYNQEIAAYTELAAPAHVPADRLVAMLIRTSTPAGQTPWSPSGVEQTAGQEPLAPEGGAAADSQAGGRQAKAAGRPQTFRGNGVREVRRPFQRLFHRDREHSIMVPRQMLRRDRGND